MDMTSTWISQHGKLGHSTYIRMTTVTKKIHAYAEEAMRLVPHRQYRRRNRLNLDLERFYDSNNLRGLNLNACDHGSLQIANLADVRKSSEDVEIQ